MRSGWNYTATIEQMFDCLYDLRIAFFTSYLPHVAGALIILSFYEKFHIK